MDSDDLDRESWPPPRPHIPELYSWDPRPTDASASAGAGTTRSKSPRVIRGIVPPGPAKPAPDFAALLAPEVAIEPDVIPAPEVDVAPFPPAPTEPPARAPEAPAASAPVPPDPARLPPVAAEAAVPSDAPVSQSQPEPTSPRTPLAPAHGILALQLEEPAPEPVRSRLDLAALVLAILLAPIGLIASIVAVVSSRRRLGYVSTMSKAALIVSIVLSVVAGGGGAVAGAVALQAEQQQAIKVSSIPLCKELATRPGILSSPSFQWPALSSTISAYVSDIGGYEKFWKHLASVAPKAIAGQARAMDAVTKTVQSRITVSRVINHDQDVADVTAAASASTLPAWATKYCD